MIKQQKNYMKACSFLGQKKAWNSKLGEILKEFPDDAVYVDLFGGSGALSLIIKGHKPNARVIWNDFDNVKELRYDRIEQTMEVKAALRAAVDWKAYAKNARLSKEDEAKINTIVTDYAERFGDLDYLSISSNILFGGKSETTLERFCRSCKYNRMTEYDADAPCFDGIERRSACFTKVYEEFKDVPNVVFVADPPYLQTYQGHYARGTFRLKDSLRVLDFTENHPYIYFTSELSDIIDLAEHAGNRLSTDKRVTRSQTRASGRNGTFTDICVYNHCVND